MTLSLSFVPFLRFLFLIGLIVNTRLSLDFTEYPAIWRKKHIFGWFNFWNVKSTLIFLTDLSKTSWIFQFFSVFCVVYSNVALIWVAVVFDIFRVFGHSVISMDDTDANWNNARNSVKSLKLFIWDCNLNKYDNI